eukprot:c20118_g1_i4.p1 GENE.c20118_g1_i4~~c20118_g1_i4.p1  ORF type:complete len:395 (+),score=63.30 c20118_g1_i4:465-1649(+)
MSLSRWIVEHALSQICPRGLDSNCVQHAIEGVPTDPVVVVECKAMRYAKIRHCNIECAEEGGEWLKHQKSCVFSFFLVEICVRVTSDGAIDRSRSQFDQGGCEQAVDEDTIQDYLLHHDEWPPGSYSLNKPSTIRVVVRSAADPYFEIQQLTHGSMRFHGLGMFTSLTIAGWSLVGVAGVYFSMACFMTIDVLLTTCLNKFRPPRPDNLAQAPTPIDIPQTPQQKKDMKWAAKNSPKELEMMCEKSPNQAALEVDLFLQAVLDNNARTVRILIRYMRNINPPIDSWSVPRVSTSRSVVWVCDERETVLQCALKHRYTQIVDAIDQELSRRLRTFLMGTLVRRNKHGGEWRPSTQISVVRMLPIDVLSMIATSTGFPGHVPARHTNLRHVSCPMY